MTENSPSSKKTRFTIAIVSALIAAGVAGYGIRHIFVKCEETKQTEGRSLVITGDSLKFQLKTDLSDEKWEEHPDLGDVEFRGERGKISEVTVKYGKLTDTYSGIDKENIAEWNFSCTKDNGGTKFTLDFSDNEESGKKVVRLVRGGKFNSTVTNAGTIYEAKCDANSLTVKREFKANITCTSTLQNGNPNPAGCKPLNEPYTGTFEVKFIARNAK